MLKENNVKKEELRARALALKTLGKIFQVQDLSWFNEEFRDYIPKQIWIIKQNLLILYLIRVKIQNEKHPAELFRVHIGNDFFSC